MEPVVVVEGGRLLPRVLEEPAVFAVVIGSTRTSTIPGISIAGPSPEGTLLTPTLDIEYLLSGRPRTLDVIPVTPEGIPTPAVITRAATRLAWDVQLLAVDAGVHAPPRVPVAVLPSRREGGRIDVEPGLDAETARAIYGEARLLGSILGRRRVLVLGESIPGGTTTALAILEALGIEAAGRVSSSAPRNPSDLKARVAAAAAERAKAHRDPLEKAASAGDPVHIALAGMTQGALEAGAKAVVLAGGTQMAAVLALLRSQGVGPSRLAVVTTRWVHEDPGSDWLGLVEEAMPGVEAGYVPLDFTGAPWPGLRAYEEGYAKEGVGAGGASGLAAVRAGLERLVEEVYREYHSLVGEGLGGEDRG